MKLTLMALLIWLGTAAMAQSNLENTAPLPDQRLYQVYEADYIDQLLEHNPFLIKRWNFYLDHAFSIIDDVPGKTQYTSEISIDNLDEINILLLEKELGLTHSYDLPVIYKIKNTNKCLVYQPGEKFAEAFRKSLTASDD